MDLWNAQATAGQTTRQGEGLTGRRKRRRDTGAAARRRPTPQATFHLKLGFGG